MRPVPAVAVEARAETGSSRPGRPRHERTGMHHPTSKGDLTMSNEKNVLVMRFADPSKAFQALSEMKAQPGIAGAAVVERTPEGQIRVADEFTPAAGDGIAVGALVGVLAGPLGVLLGWSTGFLAGAAYDADSAADTDDGFTVLSKS